MEINNSMDIIDSRDIIERIKELEEMIEESRINEQEQIDMADEKEELRLLKSLEDEAEGCPDWKYGETLIREDYFTEYAMDLLKDTGDLPDDVPWYVVIDKEKTADNIKQDYSIVDFDGVNYFIRCC